MILLFYACFIYVHSNATYLLRHMAPCPTYVWDLAQGPTVSLAPWTNQGAYKMHDVTSGPEPGHSILRY